MQASYTIRQEPDHSWSVFLVSTGDPIRLAGIPQTGLTRIEAEITLDVLRPKAMSVLAPTNPVVRERASA